MSKTSRQGEVAAQIYPQRSVAVTHSDGLLSLRNPNRAKTRNSTNSTYAMLEAVPATPLRPMAPAISATIKKANAQPSIGDPVVIGDRYSPSFIRLRVVTME